ncbi:MAG: asparagine synthase (glutamine-hydrolyzing), partial [Candidatus Brocadiales bacterium]
MCGICGFVGHPEEKGLLSSMQSTLVHRGPDDNGTYVQPGIALGHTRLSIIDLATGHQPIHNEDNTLWIVFNGEIYNYLDLREDLVKKGHQFYTKSDTEVIIHLYEEEGEDFVRHLNGEFAIALWDVPRQRLLLARDRLGIRPLYYYSSGGLFLFASEIKALLVTGRIEKQFNHLALGDYLTLRYVPGNDTLFQGVRKVPPASILIYEKSGFNISSYWGLSYQPKMRSHEELEEGFCSLLEDSVKRRMMSEVPLGAFLSGGVDSSVIVALMTRYSSEPVKTFSIGFGTDIDELDEAKVIADYLGCDHEELVTGKQDYTLLPKIVRQMDEPLGDAIIIPTYLLAQATARKVKVVLTGEGADEVLGGYVHQLTMHFGDKYNNAIPGYLQDANLALLRFLPPSVLERFFPYPARLGVKGKTKLLNYLSHLKSASRAYLDLAGLFSDQEKEELFTRDFLDNIAGDGTL